jgi:NAD dependent epimerase/dehydratase family enzyme
MILASQRALPNALTSSGYAFAHTDVAEATRSVLSPAS